MQNKLFVRNLSFTCADSDLADLFTQYGEVTSAKVPLDRDTGKSRGFGFVEMATQQQAEDAIRGLDNREFGGRIIHVSVSEPRESRSSGYERERSYN